MQRLPLHVQELGQFLAAAVGLLDPLGELALGALDDLFLLAELLGLLFQGVLPLVQQAVALVQSPRGRGAAPFRFRPFCCMASSLISSSASRRRFSTSVLGLADDFLGFRFGVAAAQAIQKLYQRKCQRRGQYGR